MPNLPPPRPAQKRNLAHRERRKIVVQQKALLSFALESFQALLIVAGAQRSRNQCLSFAARENRAPVGSWQHSHFHPDVANLIERPPVGPSLIIYHLFAEDSFAQRFVIGLQFGLR